MCVYVWISFKTYAINVCNRADAESIIHCIGLFVYNWMACSLACSFKVDVLSLITTRFVLNTTKMKLNRLISCEWMSRCVAVECFFHHFHCVFFQMCNLKYNTCSYPNEQAIMNSLILIVPSFFVTHVSHRIKIEKSAAAAATVSVISIIIFCTVHALK